MIIGLIAFLLFGIFAISVAAATVVGFWGFIIFLIIKLTKKNNSEVPVTISNEPISYEQPKRIKYVLKDPLSYNNEKLKEGDLVTDNRRPISPCVIISKESVIQPSGKIGIFYFAKNIETGIFVEIPVEFVEMIEECK